MWQDLILPDGLNVSFTCHVMYLNFTCTCSHLTTLDCNVNVIISYLANCKYEKKYKIKYEIEYKNRVLYNIKYACDFI